MKVETYVWIINVLNSNTLWKMKFLKCIWCTVCISSSDSWCVTTSVTLLFIRLTLLSLLVWLTLFLFMLMFDSHCFRSFEFLLKLLQIQCHLLTDLEYYCPDQQPVFQWLIALSDLCPLNHMMCLVSISLSSKFVRQQPFSYLGEGLDFSLCS